VVLNSLFLQLLRVWRVCVNTRNELGYPHPVGPPPPSLSLYLYILIVNIHLDKDPEAKIWVGVPIFDPPP
jgi:hypothetical protein